MSRTRFQSERGSQDVGIVFVILAILFLIAFPPLSKQLGWATWHQTPWWAKAIVIAVPIGCFFAMIAVNDATRWKKDYGRLPPPPPDKQPPSDPPAA